MWVFKTKNQKFRVVVDEALSFINSHVNKIKNEDPHAVSANINVSDIFLDRIKFWGANSDRLSDLLQKALREHGFFVYYRISSEPHRFTVTWKREPWQRKKNYVLLSQISRKNRGATQ